MLLVNTYFTIYIRKSELFEIIPLNFDITIAKSVFSSSNTDPERREVRFEMGSSERSECNSNAKKLPRLRCFRSRGILLIL